MGCPPIEPADGGDTSPHDMEPRRGTTLRESYAALIAECRRSAGLSRAELASRAGVRPHTVALWEDPSYEGVDLTILQRVARAAGTELEIRFRTPVRSEPAWKQLLQGPKP